MGSGFRARGSGFEVQGSRVRTHGSGLKEQGAGLGFRTQHSGFRLRAQAPKQKRDAGLIYNTWFVIEIPYVHLMVCRQQRGCRRESRCVASAQTKFPRPGRTVTKLELAQYSSLVYRTLRCLYCFCLFSCVQYGQVHLPELQCFSITGEHRAGKACDYRLAFWVEGQPLAPRVSEPFTVVCLR